MWCGVVWCGVVWCGGVWCGVVWCGVVCRAVVWSGVLWCAVVCCGVLWCAVVCCGVLWCAVVCCGVLWCSVVWCGVVWFGVVWCAVLCYGVVWCGVVYWSCCWWLRIRILLPLNIKNNKITNTNTKKTTTTNNNNNIIITTNNNTTSKTPLSLRPTTTPPPTTIPPSPTTSSPLSLPPSTTTPQPLSLTTVYNDNNDYLSDSLTDDAHLSFSSANQVNPPTRIAILLARLAELKRANIEHISAANQIVRSFPNISTGSLWREVLNVKKPDDDWPANEASSLWLVNGRGLGRGFYWGRSLEWRRGLLFVLIGWLIDWCTLDWLIWLIDCFIS